MTGCAPYIPNGNECNQCVALRCPGATNRLFATGGWPILETLPPVASVNEFNGTHWLSPGPPPMSVKRAYHGVAAVQHNGAWELFAIGGANQSEPTASTGVLTSVEVYGRGVRDVV